MDIIAFSCVLGHCFAMFVQGNTWLGTLTLTAIPCYRIRAYAG